MATKQKEISLLPEEKTGLQSTLEKAFDWLVNTGRWIIVFTEFNCYSSLPFPFLA